MVNDKDINIECPSCKKFALTIEHPKSVCANCRKVYKWHELQRKWEKVFNSSYNGVKKLPNGKFEFCAVCGDHSMIFYDKLKLWICFSCGNAWNKNEISKCIACQLYSDDVDDSLCSDCWNEGLGTLKNLPSSIDTHQTL